MSCKSHFHRLAYIIEVKEMKKRKSYKKIILLGIIVFILFKLFTSLVSQSNRKMESLSMASGYRDIEEIVSRNAVVIDKTNGEIIMGKNYSERIHPASMTKVMTAIIGLENVGSLSKRVIMSQDIIDYCVNNGLSVSGFELGDRPKIKDLLYGILLESGGESSIALARYISVSEEEFVNLMNKKAEDIGMTNTHFSNSTGMTDENNYSTVEDIGKLFNYALKNNRFKKIVESKNYQARGAKSIFSKHSIENNLFMKRNALNIDKSYIKCGKTGYTEAAGLCLVSLGELGSREFIVVTAHADGNSTTEQFNLTDTEKIYKQLR